MIELFTRETWDMEIFFWTENVEPHATLSRGQRTKGTILFYILGLCLL